MLWTDDGRVRPSSGLAVWRAVVIGAGVAFICWDCVAKLRSPAPLRFAGSAAVAAAPQPAVVSPPPVRIIEMTRRAEPVGPGEAEPPAATEPLSRPVPTAPPLPGPEVAAVDAPPLVDPQLRQPAREAGAAHEDRGSFCSRYNMHRVDYLKRGRPSWRCVR
jgi:hypothetical protein